MFGLHKQPTQQDKLAVLVHAVTSNEAFKMVQKIWAENARSLQGDNAAHKEILHFAYATPKCTVWLQRDMGRTDTFELIIRWEEQGEHEVYVLTSGAATTGNDQRLIELLHQILTLPSIVPSINQDNKVQ